MRRHLSRPGQQQLPFPASNESGTQDGVAIEPLNHMLAFAQMGRLPGSTPDTIASAFDARSAPIAERIRIAASLPVHVSGAVGPSRSAQIAMHEARRRNPQHPHDNPHYVQNLVDTLMQILHTRIAINGTSEEARCNAVKILRASGRSRNEIKKLMNSQVHVSKRRKDSFITTRPRLMAALAAVDSIFDEQEMEEMEEWMQPLLEGNGLTPHCPPSPAQ